MDRADFIHLVRLSEQASADDSRAYRRSVAAFAALGYFWVLGCLLLAALPARAQIVWPPEPAPFTRGSGSSAATTTRATPAAISASVQGGVRPVWAQGSRVV